MTITLANVPVCDRCENARYYWFSGAAVAAALGLLVLYFTGADHSTALLGTFVLAIFFAIIGTGKSPIRFTRVDEKTNLLKMQIYNREIAREMAAREAGRQDLDGHAEYLAMQKEKQRKQDRELMLVLRKLGILGFAGGVYLAMPKGDAGGYFLMIVSLLFCLPFEINRFRDKRK